VPDKRQLDPVRLPHRLRSCRSTRAQVMVDNGAIDLPDDFDQIGCAVIRGAIAVAEIDAGAQQGGADDGSDERPADDAEQVHERPVARGR
jgi:hypothetical protein